MRRGAIVGAAALTLLLCACAGGGVPLELRGTPAPSGAPTACPQVIVAPPKLLSPAPGSSGVDRAIGTVAVTGAPTSETLRLVATNGTTVNGGPLVASADGFQETSAIPVLASATTYTVIADNIPGYCGGPPTSATLGTFTTR